MVFVDGIEVGDIEDVALRDRRALSADGIFIVVATVSGRDGKPLAPPEVIARGVPFLAEDDGAVEEIRETVEASLAHAAKDEVREVTLLQDHLREDVAAFIYDRLRRRPMVLPVVVEV
jgi:ribonuclease J